MRLLTPPVVAYTLQLVLFYLEPITARKYQLPPRDIQSLSTGDLGVIATADPPDWNTTEEVHLKNILIPRPAGSKNSTIVQKYISSVFKRLKWHEEQDPFRWDTPIGERDFNSLIYTFDPEAPRRIIIAAHFDSVYFPSYPQDQFVGATDSAAPCAMMLDLAEFLTPILKARKDRLKANEGYTRDDFDEEQAGETTITLLFLDGEEAFKSWTATDSIYGARHLAQKWAETYLEPTHPGYLHARRFSTVPSILETIDHFVLLDLLGHRSPRLHSYYRETDWLFNLMSSADQRLRDQGLVDVENGEEGWFSTQRMMRGMIGDDHVPFNERGVSVLHLISNPFPNVWHSLGDDATALSVPAMNRFKKILRVFSCEYLGLTPDSSKISRSDNPAEDELQQRLLHPHKSDELVRSNVYTW